MDGKMALYCECCFPNCTKIKTCFLKSYGGRLPSPGSVPDPHGLSAATDSLYLHFTPTVWVLNFPRKQTNCAMSLQEHHFLMPVRSLLQENIGIKRCNVWGDVTMCRWELAKFRAIGEKGLTQLWLALISSRIFLSDFECVRKFYLRPIGPVIFANLRLNAISVLCSKDFWLEWGLIALVG